MVEQHNPLKLNFNCLYVASYDRGHIDFVSNKGHKLSINLDEAEHAIVTSIVEGARKRAMKEIPEVIAEVIAEERVQQILAKREADAALLAAPEAPADNFEPGVF